MNLLNQYKVNTKTNFSKSTNIVYSFIITGIASLIFNGFIINDHLAIKAQLIFMALASGLLSTHWYAKTFLVQRYEKKNTFFRINNMIGVLCLGFMAISIDLLVFRENKTDLDTRAFLWNTAMYLFIGSYIGSRLLISINYSLAFVSNYKNEEIKKLTIWKSLSRLLVVVLAAIHLILFHQGFNSQILIYTFMPIYLVIELLGNVINVKSKILKNAPSVSFGDLKERYSKLNIILISSIFISGSIQFAWYFKSHEHLYMIGRVFMMYLVGFALWWTYSNRVYRFEIKQTGGSLSLLTSINVLMAATLAVIGGFLINANTDKYIWIIIPAVSFGIMSFIFLINLGLWTFTHQKALGEIFGKKEKKLFIYTSIPPFVFTMVLGIVSLFITPSIWYLYGTVLASLLIMIVSSRIIINTKIKR